MKQSDRNVWLDVVRALAIILVVNCHCASDYAGRTEPSIITTVLGIGGHGVDLFFVLSGWLLGGLLFREYNRSGTIRVRRFLSRRWYRTLPAFYVVLALNLCQAIAQDRFEPSYLTYFVFAHTYVFPEPPMFGVSWSLCVEEHFYLIVAPLIWWMGRKSSKAMFVFACLLTIPPLCRQFGFYGGNLETHVRLDQCAAGVALAYVRTNVGWLWSIIQRNLPLLAFLATSVAITCVLERTTSLVFTIPLMAYTFISSVAVAFADRNDWFKSRIAVPGAYYVASRSYSMYLVHVEAISVVRKLEVESLFLSLVATWVVTAIIAEPLYRFVELPFMRLRDRKSTSNQTMPVPSDSTV